MLLDAVFFLLQAGLDLFWWAVLLAAIVQTLMAFNVLDGRNRIVWTIADFLYRVTEPALRPLRQRSRGFSDADDLVPPTVPPVAFQMTRPAPESLGR